MIMAEEKIVAQKLEEKAARDAHRKKGRHGSRSNHEPKSKPGPGES
jgi:hypothetical protein